MDETGFDSKRRLCPDGSCVGLIAADGRCTVCAQTESAAAAENSAPAESSAPADDSAPAELAAAPVANGDFDPNRRLCDDGTCVGVIGSEGRCTVCGQKAGG